MLASLSPTERITQTCITSWLLNICLLVKADDFGNMRLSVNMFGRDRIASTSHFYIIFCYEWRAKRAPHCSIQSRFRVIYIHIYISVYMSTFVYCKSIQKNLRPTCMGGITWSKHTDPQTQFWEFETKCHLESLIISSSGRLKLTCVEQL